MPRPTSPTPARTSSAPRTTGARANRLLTVLALLAPLVGLGTVLDTLPAGAADDPLDDPLRLTIERVSPAVLTDQSEVTITGIVTNESDEVWTSVNVAPLRSSYPIRDRASLAEAAASPDDTYVGDRLTEVEAITTVDSLAPGASASFTTRIPRSSVGTTPGVYWIGVHALGETATQPRDTATDGRARTFLPVAAPDTEPQDTAVVLPMRAQVRHTPEGQLANVRSWTASLSPGGRLHQLLAAGTGTGDAPVAWLVDPAVPDAVRHLAEGNQPWQLQAAGADAEPTDGEDQSSAGTEDEPPAPDESGWDDDTVAAARAARAWLTTFTEVLGTAEVYALPYGDVDVTQMTRAAPTMLATARTRSAEVLEELGVTATPAVAPIDGRIDEASVAATAPGTVVLLQDTGLVAASGTVPSVGTLLERPYAASSSGAAQGGPGPEASGNAVAVRQRVASEAVLKNLAGDSSPLVVVPPSDWSADTGVRELLSLTGSKAVRPVSLGAALDASTTTLSGASLQAPAQGRRARVPAANVRAAVAMTRPASLLESVLARPAGVDQQVSDAALTSLTQPTRRNPRPVRRRMKDTTAHLEEMLGQVQISGPAVATLSGESGRIGATLSNSLSVPVTVDVDAVTAGSLEIDAPDRVTLAPESRRRLLLQANKAQRGVQNVTLRVTSADGEALGSEATFPVRSSEVSGILWLIMAAGAAVLFGAIAVRLFRRGLASRRQQVVEEAGTEGPDGTTTDTTTDTTTQTTQGVQDADKESHE